MRVEPLADELHKTDRIRLSALQARHNVGALFMPVHSCRSLPRSFFEALSIILACISSLLPCAAQSARVDRGPVHSCSDLKSQKIGSAQIGLPTRGALIDSARLAKGAAGGYCRVLGSITSVDHLPIPSASKSTYRRHGMGRQFNLVAVVLTVTFGSRTVVAYPRAARASIALRRRCA